MTSPYNDVIFYYLLGFHANDDRRCKNFVDNGILIIDENDTDYLGKGMYFWTNSNQAKWWKAEKKKDCIVKAIINIDEEEHLLDINDSECLERLQRLFQYIRQAYNKQVKKLGYIGDAESAMGCKLNFIFDLYHSFSEKIDVIKGIYSIGEERSIFSGKTKFSTKCVEMLCVRHENVVSDRRFING